MQLPSLSRTTASFHQLLSDRQTHWRRSRAGAIWGLAAFAHGLGGCADLLDIPSHPRLAEATPGEPEQAQPRVLLPADEAREPGASSSGDALGAEPRVDAPTGEEDVRLPALNAVGAGDTEAGAASGERSDAGAAAPDAAAPPVEPIPTLPCADTGSVGPNDRCYVPVSAELSWSDARTNCLARGDGWDLASIRDRATNDFLTRLVPSQTWIGASDAEDEGIWTWVSDGAPFWSGNGLEGSALNDAFVNWNSDEPNGAGNSDCARLVRLGNAAPDSPYTWADRECFEPRGSVCEGPR
ncbi:MAG TPA: C-type lectin domain-containing protein [Polyangiaceae bacterium]|nr:C-type lectin domain-containing protein [Polyangiaceae bacterium]